SLPFSPAAMKPASSAITDTHKPNVRTMVWSSSSVLPQRTRGDDRVFGMGQHGADVSAGGTDQHYIEPWHRLRRHRSWICQRVSGRSRWLGARRIVTTR